MNTIDEMDIEVPTISVTDYLDSEKGKEALRLFRKHLKELGETPCKEHGFTYALAYELNCALSERLPSSVYYDFELKDTIMDADPKEIEEEWEAWEYSDYAGNILGSNDDEYYAEVKAAFGKWCPDND